MSELHLPWLEISILIPLVGALCVSQLRKPEDARWASVGITGLSLACALGEWADFAFLGTSLADDRWHFMTRLFGQEVFRIDQINAPLFALVSLLYFLTTLTTLRTKIRRFSFAWSLVSEAILLATFSCTNRWGLVGLLALGTIPPYLELLARKKPTRIYLAHAGLFILLMIAGELLVQLNGVSREQQSLWALLPLTVAVLIRSGMAPFHCWMTDLFEHATFGTALLFAAPITGAFAAVRLLLPIAPPWTLQAIAAVSLITAVYAAGLALIQKDARRVFCHLVVSHCALVLLGLAMVNPIGLAGALSVWLGVGLALGGLGLTLRALESRGGRLALDSFQGHYEHTPNLAMCFALTGLASVGFPGTLGFIGTELLVDGAVLTSPFVGIAVVLATAINSITIVKAYFVLFTGTQYTSSVSLKIRLRERYAVLALATLLLLGGLAPQLNIASRYKAALELLPTPAVPEEAATAYHPAGP